MKKHSRCFALILAAVMLLGAAMTARADVASVGVYFTGVAERSDGTWMTVPLEGRFRVMQNGTEIGRIAPGETVTVTSPDRVQIEPLPESMPAGWDLSGAPWTANIASGGTTVIPITVYPCGYEGKTAPRMTVAAETPAPVQPALPEDDVTDAPDEDPLPEDGDGDETGEETEDPAGEDMDGLTDDEAGDDAEEDASAYMSDQADIAGRALPTVPPTAQPTPEPAPEARAESEGTGAVRVFVFSDGNANGEFGKYETPVSGIQIYLLKEDLETAVGAGKTDDSGEAVFRGLEPGGYVIRAKLPGNLYFGRKGPGEGLNSSCMNMIAGGEQDSAPVSVRAGATAERGIGVTKAVTVSGFCWLETEADGVKKEGEQMLPGVRITLTGQKNNLEYEVYSDENGNWTAEHVRPGFYTLTAYVPDGMMFTRYSVTGGKNRSYFTADGVRKASKTLDTNDGVSVENVNIGFAWSAEVSGICFLDANYNGVYDEGETPLPGVMMTAFKQVKDEEVCTAVSGEDGRYTLSGLRGNTYKIRARLPNDGADFTKTVSDPLGNHFGSRAERRENFWNNYVIRDAERYTVNVGAIYPGSVSGTVYMDDDFSAAMNGKEKTVSGFTVALLDAEGGTYATDKTNAKGVYKFEGLVPGTYSLSMTATEGYAFTKRGDGNVMLNRNLGVGYSEPFRVEIGQNLTGMDAGMIRPGTVTGSVFADLNDNGLRDSGENGLEGATVRLMSEEGEAFSAEIGPDGIFLFDAVMPGRYFLRYELPEHAIFAKNVQGGNTVAGENGTGDGEWFDFKTGQRVDAPLCGGLTLGRITGIAFTDHTGSGVMTDGDGPFAGVKLTLIPTKPENRTYETETGADGSFAMEDLHPDDYLLGVEFPDGYVSSRTNGLTLPVTPGMQGQVIELNVPMGAVWEDQQLGGVIPAELRGRVWLDENDNGRYEADERTPEGLEIVITDETTGTVFRTLTTDADGIFETAGAVPGDYSVSLEIGENTAPAKPGDSTFTQDGNRLVMTGIHLEENDSRDDILLGLIRYTNISGRVWIDRGGDVEPLKGAVIALFNGDGALADTAETDENGGYRFGMLMPDVYTIHADMPAGCVIVEPDDARLTDGLVSVAWETNGRSGDSEPFDLKMGKDRKNMDIGCVLPGRLGDYCWLDLNGNGWQDGDEPGITGVRIELMRNGRVYAETVSGNYGFYWFDDVYPAEYTLRVTPPAEIVPTVRKTDIPLLVSSLEETDDEVCFTVPFEVRSDSANYNVDLGFACRTDGVLPEGLNQGPTQDWSK